jgi:membrane-associated phospholipid phosphatase
MPVNAAKLHGRFLIVIIWTSILYIGYQLTNHFQVFEAHHLPLTFIDKAIPFLPWTVIPYLFLILGMYLFAFINHREDFFTALVALTIAVTINYSIYLIYPTVFNRPPAPDDGLAVSVYLWLVSIDSPANCLPSGHITTPAIGCWYLMQHRKRARIPLSIIFVLLALTTLTTKQHYLIDIPAGLATAFIGGVLAQRFIHRDSGLKTWLFSLWRTG